MSLQVRNALIGFGVAFVISFGLKFAGGGNISIVPAMVLGMFTWYFLSNVANNRKVQSVPDAERDAMLASSPSAGSGFVYVYRDGFMGKAVGMDVVVDSQQVAQLKSPRFTRLVLPAGDHTLAAGPKGFSGAQNKAAATAFALGEGETIVFALRLKAGMVQNSVTLEREADARVALSRLRLMTMVAPDENAVNPAGVASIPSGE